MENNKTNEKKKKECKVSGIYRGSKNFLPRSKINTMISRILTRNFRKLQEFEKYRIIEKNANFWTKFDQFKII